MKGEEEYERRSSCSLRSMKGEVLVVLSGV
jgi:hypothetical protein